MPREALEWKGLFNSQDETKTPKNKLFSMSNASCDEGVLQIGARYKGIGSRPGYAAGDVCWGQGYGLFTTNSTQKLDISNPATTGTVVLEWSPDGTGMLATAALPYDSTAQDVQDALLTLTNTELGDISCAGGPWPNVPIYATFRGRYRGITVALIHLKTNGLSLGTLNITQYVTAGANEELVIPIQHAGETTAHLYKVTSADNWATTVWTSIATGLTASDWFMLQYVDRVWAVNGSDGLLYKQLGGAWSGALGIPGVQNPTAAPTAISDMNTTVFWPTAGMTFGNYVGWAANPTISIFNSAALKIVLNATQPLATVSFDITLPAAANLSYEDDWTIETQVNATTEISLDGSGYDILWTNNDGPAVTIQPTYRQNAGIDFGTTFAGIFEGRRFQFGSEQRSQRDNVITWTVTLKFTAGTNAKFFWIFFRNNRVWVNNQMANIDVDNGPILHSIQYAYSYYQASSKLETKLSPSFQSPLSPGNPKVGCFMNLTAPVSSQLTALDFVVFYRRDRFGVWKRLAHVPNTGTVVSFTDKLMLDELDDLDFEGALQLPGGLEPQQIGLFKQSMVLAADRKAWLSFVGAPLVYAPDPDDLTAEALDPSVIDRPRTTYVAVNRSDNVVSIVGQDALYLGGENSCYAMTNGDRPSELSAPRPLPGSRGCISTRGGAPLSGGALFPSLDGLWYYSVSAGFTGLVATGTIIEEEVTKEVRKSYLALVGASGTGIVALVYQEETWVFNGAKYLKFTRNKLVESGTFADTVKMALGTRNGIFFVSNSGKLFKIGTYVTDDGATVPWSATTGILDGPRTSLDLLEVQFQGNPKVKVEVWDGEDGPESQTFDLQDQKVNHYPAGVLLNGYRYRITCSGTGADKITALALHFSGKEGTGQGN